MLNVLGRLAAVRGTSRVEHSFQEVPFGHRSLDRLLVVDDGLGDGVDAVLIRSIRKFRGFNAIGRNQVVLHCKLVGQAHRPWAVRSGGRDKDFQMDRLADSGKLLLGFRHQP
jgi:hypothetical protein